MHVSNDSFDILDSTIPDKVPFWIDMVPFSFCNMCTAHCSGSFTMVRKWNRLWWLGLCYVVYPSKTSWQICSTKITGCMI